MVNPVLSLCVAAVLSVGCSNRTTESELLLHANGGDPPATIDRQLISPSTHQFTALIDGEEVLGVTHDFRDPYMRLFLIYRNHSLAKIVDVPPESVYHIDHPIDKDSTDRPLVNPERRIRTVLAAPALSNDQLRARVERLREEEDHWKRYYEPGALWLAVIITAPLTTITWPREIREHCEKRNLLKRFDPWKIRLGMTADEADAALGKPWRVALEGDDQVRVYGEFADIENGGEPDYSWIAMTLRDGCVIRVFSHDFFDVSLRGSRTTYSD